MSAREDDVEPGLVEMIVAASVVVAFSFAVGLVLSLAEDCGVESAPLTPEQP